MCTHAAIVVDYHHPHGDLLGAPVADLIATPSPREVMTLANARCASCGKAFTPRELGARIEHGGDLYSPSFRWAQ